MRLIKIQLDYSHGPIWKEKFNPITGEWSTGIDCIDKDKALQVLNDEAERLYSSLYIFDEDGIPCQFDKKKYNEIVPQLKSIVDTIIERLNMIADGSYSIENNCNFTVSQVA